MGTKQLFQAKTNGLLLGIQMEGKTTFKSARISIISLACPTLRWLVVGLNGLTKGCSINRPSTTSPKWSNTTLPIEESAGGCNLMALPLHQNKREKKAQSLSF